MNLKGAEMNEEIKKKHTAIDFGYKIAKVMNDLKSSHVFFIIQTAYGEIFWDEAQEILNEVIKDYELLQKKSKPKKL